jgi:sodium transport system permease protein
MKPRIWIIFWKEVVDNVRDLRSLLGSLASSIALPLLIVPLIIIVGKQLNISVVEEPLRIPVVGAENAPHLIAYLEQKNVIVLPAPADPQAGVREGDLEAVLVIPEGYGEDFIAGRPAKVQVIQDTSRSSAMVTNARLERLLYAYSGQVSTQRLLARGIDPSLTQVLTVQSVDLATPQSQAMIFLGMLPFMMTSVIFLGGMYVIIDTTAGERERGSLEPLLINPARRSDFVLGKMLASLPFGVLSVLVALIGIGAGFNLVPIGDLTGLRLHVSFLTLWQIFLICLPMIVLASAMQMVLATLTRSFKEAQTYLGFVPLVVGMPGMFLAFMPSRTTLVKALIPIYGQSMLINQLMRGETLQPVNILSGAATTLLAAVACTYLAIRLYQRERILHGGGR